MKKNEKKPRSLKRTILLLFILGIVLTGTFINIFILVGYIYGIKPVSYLPDIKSDVFRKKSREANLVAINSAGCLLSVDDRGSVNVTVDGAVVLSDLLYYSSYAGTEDKWGLDDISATQTSDSTISITGKGSSGTLVSILLTVPGQGDRLDVGINTKYTLPSIVEREALVAGFGLPVSEVYCKNGDLAVDSLDSEYWLNRQGVKFGKGNKSALIYHTPGISSLQLDLKRDLVYMNLEYSLDHPHVNIPYQEDGGERGRWEDQSMANWLPGLQRNNYFSIYFSNLPEATPRLMLVPGGYLAGYVFTEHADGGNISTHRAVYFGSDTIEKIENAVGGFAGNRIPVTKSVFYADPFSEKYPSVRDNPEYLDFLDQLYATGYDICLHTPENFNSNRQMMEESVRFMKERFDAVTWIDHGMYGGKENRESLVADGLNPDSEYYSADIWEKYGTKYFWTPAVEMILGNSRERIQKLKLYEASRNFWTQYMSTNEIKKMGFGPAFIELLTRYTYKGEFNSLLPYKGNAFPTPLYYQHLTRTKSFYSWVTGKGINYKNLWTDKAEAQFERDLTNLDKLVTERGIYINHGYYIRNMPFYDTTEELSGSVKLNPYFERELEYMAKMRDKGDLYISTIRDLLNYWILTENVSFSYSPDGEIIVFNNNDIPIKGLSLAVKSSEVLVNGEIPKSRQDAEDTIFWFDLNANDNATIKISHKSN